MTPAPGPHPPEDRPAAQVLILPGWQGPSPQHWTGRWPLLHGYGWVDQYDWQRPLRGDWLMRLEEAVLALNGPIVLAAHGLGSLLAVAWAACSRQASRVSGALLVAPPDIKSEPWLSRLPSWTDVGQQRLPFPSLVLAADSSGPPDSAQTRQRTGQWACAWGARWLDERPGPDAGPDPDWPQGHALLQELIEDKTWSPKNPKAWAAA